ncbi:MULTISPECIES: hypothetical protein [Lysinibacillus]|uniref:Antitoxin epsilon/PezA domain-containing protein n=1 Tax=Lysinibacillus xylanilyticus TaxID=582475 RepID=A0ABV3VYD2_9BACI
MEKPLNYVHTFKIELLNEFSNGVHARLVNFIIKSGIDKNDKNNFYVALLDQFVKMLNLDLFKMSFEELEALEGYWKNMNSYIKEIKRGNLGG